MFEMMNEASKLPIHVKAWMAVMVATFLAHIPFYASTPHLVNLMAFFATLAVVAPVSFSATKNLNSIAASHFVLWPFALAYGVYVAASGGIAMSTFGGAVLLAGYCVFATSLVMDYRILLQEFAKSETFAVARKAISGRAVAATAVLALGLAVSASVADARMAQISKNPGLYKQAYVLDVSVEIDQPADKVWALLGEGFEQNIKFNLDAASTKFIRGSEPMVGAQRRTVNHAGKFMDVEVVEYDPSRQFVAWEIINTDFAPIKFGFGKYKITPVSENRTRVTQRAGFKMRNSIMDVMARFRFPGIFVYELAVIKHTLETGQSKTSLTKDEYKARYFSQITTKKYF